ncbi:MAG: DMT family transporter [Bacteroidales bacterium]|nr:DMT family transporter [Bacteroidales bacterium]MCF8390896.1 DMT family transporter [Bacteroidales bacterium]
MNNQTKAYVYAGLTILFWSTVATAFKIALAEQSIYQVLIVATLSSLVVLGISLFMSGKFKLIFKSTRKEILYSAAMGFMNPAFYYLVLFKAYDNLPAQVAQPLNLIWPIIIVLISIPLLKQKVEAKSFIALFVSFTGIILVSSQGGGKFFKTEQIPYMLMALSTSIIWSFYWIMNVRDTRDESIKLFMGFGFAAIILLSASFFIENPFPRGINQWAVDIYIGFFEMGLAFLFWMKALQFTKSTDKISNLIFIFPFISLIFIHYLLGEAIHLTTLYGLLLVVAGIFLQKTKFQKRKNVR